MLTFLDFFSGIGGFRLGMEQNGFKCVGHCEIDKFADKSYRAMHEPREDEWYGSDIRDVQPGDLPDADCYCFGFPCQAFSVAGKRGGFADTRGTLFFEVMRLAETRRPKLLFAENDAGLLSHDGGFTFGTILSTMGELGYDVQYQVLNSKDFGVPQNRERVFIIGSLRGQPRPEVFPIFPTDREVIEPDQSELIFVNQPSFGDFRVSETRQTLKARDYKDPVMVIQKTHGATTTVNYDETGTLQAARLDKIPCVIPCLTPGRPEKRQNGRRFKEPGEDMFTLTGQDVHGLAIMGVLEGAGHEQNRRVYGSCGLSPTLNGIGNGGNHEPKIMHEWKIRKLTPLECFRLQGFPDELFYKAKAVNSDSQLYKQAGNSVTVNVIRAIAERMKEVYNA